MYPLAILLALLSYPLIAVALPDPRYLNVYGQVIHGPPVQARKLPTFHTFDPNSVCTLTSQNTPSLNGYDYAFCCREDSPLLDFFLGVSFQTCKLACCIAISYYELNWQSPPLTTFNKVAH